MTDSDRLVEEYLAEVARACAGLATSVRMELLADLREHIAVARAELAVPSEAGVRAILDRLGEPAVIAAEARASVPGPVAAPFRPAVAGHAVPPAPPPMSIRRNSGLAIVVATVILVPVILFVVVLVVGFLAYYVRA